MGSKRRVREGLYIRMYDAAPGASVVVRKQRTDGFLPEKQEAFFERLGETFNIAESARHAGVGVSTVHVWRKVSPEFAERFAEALMRGYLDVKMRMIAIAMKGARRTSTVIREEENKIVTRIVDDAPAHVMSVLRYQLEEIAALHKAQAEQSAEETEPGEEQLVAWLRADLDAIEATMPIVRDDGENDDADELSDG